MLVTFLFWYFLALSFLNLILDNYISFWTISNNFNRQLLFYYLDKKIMYWGQGCRTLLPMFLSPNCQKSNVDTWYAVHCLAAVLNGYQFIQFQVVCHLDRYYKGSGFRHGTSEGISSMQSYPTIVLDFLQN